MCAEFTDVGCDLEGETVHTAEKKLELFLNVAV
jgi:hypothetical protein